MSLKGDAGYRVVWALDPFERDEAFHRSMLSTIRAFTRRRPFTVEPVYLLDARIPEFSAIASGERIGAVTHFAVRRLGQVLGDSLGPGFLPLRVVDSSYEHPAERAHRLIQFAKSSGTDLIAISTHSRRRLERWVLGSFAETVLRQSHIPVLLISPHCKVCESLEHVLFPTDLSDVSEEAFDRLLPIASRVFDAMTIFHRMEYRIPPTMDREMGARRERGSRWRDRARAAGLETAFLIDSTPGGGVAEAILEQADRRPGLIAMATKSSRIRAATVGSVALSVLRSSPYAIWLFPPLGAGESETAAAKTREAA